MNWSTTLLAGSLAFFISYSINMTIIYSAEHTARISAEAKVQTVSEYVKTQMQDKQTRAIMCAK